MAGDTAQSPSPGLLQPKAAYMPVHFRDTSQI